MTKPDQPTILCVDDEPNILSALKRVLRKEGYTVLTATSGREGLALLEEHAVQLVISDQRMPEMTGAEFLKEVKDRWPQTTRVILSGYAEAEAILDAVNNGAIFKFLVKPWQDQDLKQEIRTCLAHNEEKAALYEQAAENRNNPEFPVVPPRIWSHKNPDKQEVM
ncbi:MAG: response regulator [Vampirovibrio sp.]|nr:response regulator [Vampirovibrio sp.]